MCGQHVIRKAIWRISKLEIWNLNSAVSALCGCLSFACFEKKLGKGFVNIPKFVNLTHNKYLFLWHANHINFGNIIYSIPSFKYFLVNNNLAHFYEDGMILKIHYELSNLKWLSWIALHMRGLILTDSIRLLFFMDQKSPFQRLV